jgi:putative ABC transport system permease protein
MSTVIQDVRYAWRMLRQHPGFTAVAVATLALGMGANTVIFTVVNAVLLQPLPFPASENIVRLQEKHDRPLNLTGRTFHDVYERNHVFSEVAAYRVFSQNLSDTSHGAPPEEIDTAFVSQDFFSLLQIRPRLGHDFSPEQFLQGAQETVLLSHGLWQGHFASDPQIVGRLIVLHGTPRMVAGVMPAGFTFPDQAQAWAPLTEDNALQQNRRAHLFTTIARVKSGIAPATVTADLQTIAVTIQRENLDVDPGFVFRTQALKENLVANVRPALLLLLGGVGFILLIACANVANLLLSRSVARQREIAVRAALGADRFRLVQQFLCESFLLGAAGGILGCLVGFWTAQVLAAAYPGAIPRLETPGLDAHVIVFVLAMSSLSTLLFGVFPAVQLSNANLRGQLAEGRRSTGTAARHRVRSSLVVGEVALAMVLLAGAGLLIRSFKRLQRVDPGYDTSHLLVASVTLPGSRYPELRQRQRFVDAVLDRIRSLPGVRSAAAGGSLPLRPVPETDFDLEGLASQPGDEPSAQVLTASPTFFQVLGIRLLAGRVFTAQDVPGQPTAMVINQKMARRYWPHQTPLGKKIVMKDWGPPLPGEIVGVVSDVRVDSMDAGAQPAVYMSLAQFQQGTLTTYVIVRTDSSVPGLASAIRSQIWVVDKEQPVSVFTMDQVISESLERRRFLMTLSGIFAGLALLLAVIGIYGVVTDSVGQRTYEFGIRLALGAQRHQVLLLVLKQGIGTISIGIGLGVVAAFALTRLLRSLLFEVSSTDVLTFSLISGLLVTVALLASYFPAARAAKVDPIVALRYE